MSNTVKNRTQNRKFELLDGMEVKALTTAMEFYAGLKKGGKKLRVEWYNVGNVLISAKFALDGNTKKFGAWREKHFPGINPSVASCAQTISRHETRVEKWAAKNSPAINNPMTLLRLYQSDTAIRLKSDGTTEKIVEPEVTEVPEAGKNDGGIDTMLETFRKSVNAIIATDFENWTASHITKIDDIVKSMEKWSSPESEVSDSNPIDPDAEFIDPERKAAIVKEIATSTQIGQ